MHVAICFVPFSFIPITYGSVRSDDVYSIESVESVIKRSIHEPGTILLISKYTENSSQKTQGY